ncbi:cytochrome C552 [Methylovirgula ligni]|uniref:Cbb3-type cytochrome c oxidase subunit III n=1 Tax=Methylovirgula ligni TaxID=569860 RepID=A0A3D9YQB1_9HYPH|nr:cytochrome c [Methylovirgula ligni]QAY94802.1 cytochrome C552 [Methylovirgula ligni]REF84777.1 cbb3-type cytochrome c oxidase subunit III [Methylovirgula ligni]
MLRLISRLICFDFITIFALPALAATPPDPAQGQTIVKRWCAGCHQVAPDQKPVSSDVPSFVFVAHQEKLTEKVLSDFLATSHPRMPDMALTRAEIADIVAYIKSLDR